MALDFGRFVNAKQEEQRRNDALTARSSEDILGSGQSMSVMTDQGMQNLPLTERGYDGLVAYNYLGHGEGNPISLDANQYYYNDQGTGKQIPLFQGPDGRMYRADDLASKYGSVQNAWGQRDAQGNKMFGGFAAKPSTNEAGDIVITTAPLALAALTGGAAGGAFAAGSEAGAASSLAAADSASLGSGLSAGSGAGSYLGAGGGATGALGSGVAVPAGGAEVLGAGGAEALGLGTGVSSGAASGALAPGYFAAEGALGLGAGVANAAPTAGAGATTAPGAAPTASATPPAAPAGGAAPAGTAPAATAAPESFTDSLIKQLKANALGLGLIGAGTLASTNQKTQIPNQQQIQGLGEQGAAVANDLLSRYRAQQLMPGQQASLDQLVQNTKNQLRQYFAASGQADSTAAAQAMAQVDQAALAMKQQMLDTALTQGLQAIGVAQGPLNTIANYQLAQDQQLRQAFGNFATGAGLLFGRSAGTTQRPTGTAMGGPVVSSTQQPQVVQSSQSPELG